MLTESEKINSDSKLAAIRILKALQDKKTPDPNDFSQESLLTRVGLKELTTLSMIIQEGDVAQIPQEFLTPELLIQKIEEKWANSYELLALTGNGIYEIPPCAFSPEALQTRFETRFENKVGGGTILHHILGKPNPLPFDTQILINFPKLLEMENEEKQTPIHTAAWRGNVKTLPAKCLSAKNLLQKDKGGNRPIHSLLHYDPPQIEEDEFRCIPIQVIHQILTAPTTKISLASRMRVAIRIRPEYHKKLKRFQTTRKLLRLGETKIEQPV